MDSHMITVTREAARYHTERFPGLWQAHPDIARDGIELGRALSVQIVGARHSDQRLLAIARYLEDIFAVTIDYDGLARAAQMDVRRLRRRYA